MFSIFVYLFCAVISFWASRHFRDAWNKVSNKNYRDFHTFFFILGIGFLIFPSALLAGSFAGIGLEVGLFFILLGFAFVLRSFVRFQNIKSFSPDTVRAFIVLLALLNLIVGITYAPVPAIQDNLIYWHTPLFSSISFGVLIILFTVSMGITMFSNIKNVQKNKHSILFLGFAFTTGGMSGEGVVSMNSFIPLLLSYAFLFVTFVFVLLFIITTSREK